MRIFGRGITVALLGVVALAGALAFGMANEAAADHEGLLDLDSMQIIESTQENIGEAVLTGVADAVSGDVDTQLSQIADTAGTCTDALVCAPNIVNVGVGLGLSGPALSFGTIGATNIIQSNVGITTQVAPNLIVNADPDINIPVDASTSINFGDISLNP